MNAPVNTTEFTEGPLTLDEMIKIVSLLENPSEAAHVRRSMRFYDVPERLRAGPYKWGTTEDLRKALWHYALPQHPAELEWMLERVKGATSLLEVGSSFGGTLKRLASVMPKGSLIVSVDLPCDETPKFLNPGPTLQETCRQIGILGGRVELFVGDSHAPEVVQAVSDLAPFDFVFIDGDHTYEGVKQDWENYGPLGHIVAFHDIGAALPQVHRFWNELKASGEYRTEECVSQPGPDGSFGIGIVYRDG